MATIKTKDTDLDLEEEFYKLARLMDAIRTTSLMLIETKVNYSNEDLGKLFYSLACCSSDTLELIKEPILQLIVSSYGK